MPRGKRGYSFSEENFPGCDVTADEWEFMRAIEAYKRRYRKRYPAWRDVLGVLKSLGYRKVDPPAEPPKSS